jgi:hypothetical protein
MTRALLYGMKQEKTQTESSQSYIRRDDINLAWKTQGVLEKEASLTKIIVEHACLLLLKEFLSLSKRLEHR